MKFCFGDIVVVEQYLIGVIVKSWVKNNKYLAYEVYVRNYNSIKEYNESDIQRYMVRHKELNEEDIEYQKESLNPFISEDEKDLFAKCLEKEDFTDFFRKNNW